MSNSFNSYIDNKKIDTVLLFLFKANEASIDLLETIEKLPTYGKVEAFIFNVYLSKIFLKKINPYLFKEIQNAYDATIIASLEDWELNLKVPDITDFVNYRASFFMDELEAMQMNENWLPSRLYYVFYENPLTNNPRPSMNFPNIVRFQFSFVEMMKSVKESVEIIDSQIK
jgi:hypothetical protein